MLPVILTWSYNKITKLFAHVMLYGTKAGNTKTMLPPLMMIRALQKMPLHKIGHLIVPLKNRGTIMLLCLQTNHTAMHLLQEPVRMSMLYPMMKKNHSSHVHPALQLQPQHRPRGLHDHELHQDTVLYLQTHQRLEHLDVFEVFKPQHFHHRDKPALSLQPGTAYMLHQLGLPDHLSLVPGGWTRRLHLQLNLYPNVK